MESQRTIPPNIRKPTAKRVTENVYEDGGDFGIVGDQFEGLFNGFGSCSSPAVEEVGGFTTV